VELVCRQPATEPVSDLLQVVLSENEVPWDALLWGDDPAPPVPPPGPDQPGTSAFDNLPLEELFSFLKARHTLRSTEYQWFHPNQRRIGHSHYCVQGTSSTGSGMFTDECSFHARTHTHAHTPPRSTRTRLPAAATTKSTYRFLMKLSVMICLLRFTLPC